MSKVLTFRQRTKGHFPSGWGPEDILPGLKAVFAVLIWCVWKLGGPDEIALEIILNFVATSDNYALNPVGKFDIPNLHIYGGTSLCLLTGSPIPPSDWDLCLTNSSFWGINLRDEIRKVAEGMGKVLGREVEIVKEWEVIGTLGIPDRNYAEFRAGRFKFSIRSGSSCTSTSDLFESGLFFNLRTGENEMGLDFPKYNPKRFRFYWVSEEIYDEAHIYAIRNHADDIGVAMVKLRKWFFETQQARFEKHQSRLEKAGVKLIKVHTDRSKCICVIMFQQAYFCKPI